VNPPAGNQYFARVSVAAVLMRIVETLLLFEPVRLQSAAFLPSICRLQNLTLWDFRGFCPTIRTLSSLLKNGFLVRRRMFRLVQGVWTAGKSRDLLRFNDVEIDEANKPQPKSSFSTGCQPKLPHI
jgi:hypothetical protein